MSEKLQKLMEMAKKVKVSPEDREAQRISFAYGNTTLENQDVTREDVIRASATLKERASEPGESHKQTGER